MALDNPGRAVSSTALLANRPAWLPPLCLVLFCLVIYGPGRFENTSGDNISARYWPVSILKYGTLTLDPFKRDLRGVAYAAIYRADGTWVPRTNWGMLPLLVPVYAAADLLDVFGNEWTHDRISRVGRLTAITWAIASVVILYCFLLKIVSQGPAFFSAALFATGTWHWSLGAQGPGLQIGAVFLSILNLHILWRLCGDRSRKAAWSSAALLGALHAWMWSIRPQDLYLFAPVGVLLLERRVLMAYLLPFGAGVVATAEIYEAVYGHWLGFYNIVNLSADMKLYRWDPLPGAAGLLFSPNRGAIVFFPLLLVLPYLWYKLMPVPSLIGAMNRAITGTYDATVTRMQRFSLVLALGSATYFFSVSILDFWHGSWSYGSRYLYDLQPYVWAPITLALADLGRLLTRQRPLLAPAILAAVLLLGLQGVVIHGLGHRNGDIYIWNLRHSPVDDKATWDMNDWIVADTWKAGSNRDRWPSAIERLRQYGF